MKYSLEDREQAAIICQIAASNPGYSHSYGKVVDALGWKRESRAMNLAVTAWGITFSKTPWLADARAEAMIRNGEVGAPGGEER